MKFSSKCIPVWLFVIVLILFNFFILKDTNFRNSLPFIHQIQYGDFLIQKWFLLIFAFGMFFQWFLKKHNLRQIIILHWKKIATIALVLLFVHIFSFLRWFDFDDYRVIGTHYDVVGTNNHEQMGLGNSTYYAIGMVYFVVRWFGTHFAVYNSFGLFIYLLVGVTLYAFVLELLNRNTKLEINKKEQIALFAALFFITSPTYWRQTIMMQEQMGDGFGMLLTVLASYFVIKGFFPLAVLFAASAIEFGLSRTHYIGVSLTAMSLLLSPKSNYQAWEKYLSIAIFLTLPLLYISSALKMYPVEVISTSSPLSNWPQALRVIDTIFGATIPHEFIYPVIANFHKLFPKWIYVSVVLGTLLLLFLSFMTVWLIIKKRFSAAKIVAVGLFIVIIACVFPTFKGIRLVYNYKSLTAQYLDFYPAAPTSYGLHAMLGMMIVLVGILVVAKTSMMRKVVIGLIILNGLTIMHSDFSWAKEFNFPQRRLDPQLTKVIPADMQIKAVYTPPPSRVLSRYVYQFYELYRIREPLYITNDAAEFIKLLDQYKPARDHVYIFTYDDTYNLRDYSDQARIYYPGKLTPEFLDSLPKKN